MEQSIISSLRELCKDKTLLLINDDVVILKSETELFSMLFKEVSVSQLPSNAIEKLRTKQYDLIITDNMMPEMDGTDLIKMIRNGEIINEKHVRNIPVLTLTGDNTKTSKELFESFRKDYPPYDFFVRPYKVEEFDIFLEQILLLMK